MLGASFARLLAFPYNIVLFTVILMDLLLKYPGIKFVRLYTSFHSLQFNIKLYGLFILLPRASLLYYYMPGT